MIRNSIDVFRRNLSGLQVGRASVNLLEPVRVDCSYGRVPIHRLGRIAIVNQRAMAVNIFDDQMVGLVDKAIRVANIGLNPTVNGNTIHIAIPQPSGERRQELLKQARQYAESAKVTIRNIRRDEIENGQKIASADERQRFVKAIDQATNAKIAEIDGLLKKKEAEILNDS